MRPFPVAMGVLGVSLGIVGIATSTLVFSLLGVALVIAAGLALTISKTATTSKAEIGSDLSPEGWILLRPLRKLAEELETAKQRGDSASPFLAEEAVNEARRLLKESSAALALRDRLVRQARGEYEATKNVEELEGAINSAATEDERISLQSALSARKEELTHYGTLNTTIAAIESSVRQAEAVLAEMKARMASGAAGALANRSDDQLREAIGRMKALSSTLSETQDLGQL